MKLFAAGNKNNVKPSSSQFSRNYEKFKDLGKIKEQDGSAGKRVKALTSKV